MLFMGDGLCIWHMWTLTTPLRFSKIIKRARIAHSEVPAGNKSKTALSIEAGVTTCELTAIHQIFTPRMRIGSTCIQTVRTTSRARRRRSSPFRIFSSAKIPLHMRIILILIWRYYPADIFSNGILSDLYLPCAPSRTLTGCKISNRLSSTSHLFNRSVIESFLCEQRSTTFRQKILFACGFNVYVRGTHRVAI